MLPGLPYHVHDDRRPHPPLVTPAAEPGGPPSDAIVLFDGKDFSAWTSHHSDITRGGTSGAPEWKLENGYFEVVPHTGDIATKEKFGDCQLHVEWAAPPEVQGNSQSRGNSGVILQGRYEVQVLDPWNNPTYADGQAGALYMAAARESGAEARRVAGLRHRFEGPRFEGEKQVKPAYITVFADAGVLLHNRKESMGPMVYRHVAHYSPQPAEDVLVLQNHNCKVRFRNIWITSLQGTISRRNS